MPLARSVDFQVPNRRPAVARTKHVQVQETVALADRSVANEGNISFDVCACVPTFSGKTGSTDVGLIQNLSATSPFYQANQDVRILQAQYTHAIVVGAKLEVHAYPQACIGSVATPDGQEETEVYAAEANVIVSCSANKMAHGSTSAVLSTNNDSGNLRRRYNTQVKGTRFNFGAASVGAAVTSYYRPRVIHQFKDLLDNRAALQYATGLDGASDPQNSTLGSSPPTDLAYWTITLVPKCRVGIVTAAPANATVRGRVLPHRLTFKTTFDILYFYDTPMDIPNEPWSAGDAQAAASQRTVFEGASAAASMLGDFVSGPSRQKRAHTD